MAVNSFNQSAIPASLGFAAGKNKIINGDFFINQRGFTSASNTAGFKFDRWDVSAFNSGTITDSSQTFTPGTAPVAGYEGATYYRVVTDGSAGVGNYWFLRQKIEDVRTLANQTATISFWAKAASGTPKIAVEITQNFGSGGSPSAAVDTYVNQVTLSTSWARYSVTVNVPSLSGKTIGTTANSSSLQLNLWFTAGSNYNSRTGSLGIQAATFDLWGVQVEAGSTATAFQTATGTLQGELAACQRYYYRQNAQTAYTHFASGGFANSSTGFKFVVATPVEMRIVPTSIDFSNLAAWDGGATYTFSALALEYCNKQQMGLTGTSTGMTTNRPGLVLSQNTTSAFLGFNAEL